MKTYKTFLLTCIILLIVATGCGKGYVPLSGRVTFSDTGEPLEKGLVCLTNGLIIARGTIRKDGKYQIGSYTQTDGLPPGKYRVYISEAEKIVGTRVVSEEHTETLYAPLIAAKHTRPETSGWEFEIDKTTRTLNLQVERPEISNK